MKKISTSVFLSLTLLISCQDRDKSKETNRKIIHELNEREIATGDKVVAVVGATLIDGKGGDPIPDATVIIRNNTIAFAGKTADADVPDGAERVDAKGMAVLAGLIDAHYHNDYSQVMPPLYLRHGITSVRDPGAWIDYYDSVRMTGKAIPRLFLTGPHIDMYPPAYPENSYLVKDPEEGRLAVELFVSQGATAIKVYFRLSVGIIREVCKAAHEHGIPVTGHLEIANARDAINAGLDGIEHITSFGTCLLPLRKVEEYKQKVTADNHARERGRYEAWNIIEIDNNPVADSLVRFLAAKKTFVSPTLAVFERQADRGDSVEVHGFSNMVKFVGKARKAGVHIVVGSHTWVPYAETGFAYFREMELLGEAGMTPMQIIQAATSENASFLRIDERLGTIEPGKLADLILVEGDPLADIRNMRNVRRVMLNGVWVPTATTADTGH
ncbi:MAG TPA: amidohydrolase family protein [Chryseosolibacter sp.]